VLSAAFALLKAGFKKAENTRRTQNEKDFSDHSNSVALGGMGSGTKLAQHAAVDNTGYKLATVNSIVNLTEPATRYSRHQHDHDADHNHANHPDLKQQQHLD
jgi:hypothetical protein